MKEKKMKKKAYIAPRIVVEEIAMEEGIATGSAKVTPVNDTGVIKSEWKEGSDISRDINWN